MSKTATWGTPGSTCSHPRMPCNAPGLWSGAKGDNFSISANACSSSFTGWEYFSPPCTMRWPTASISEICFRQPPFAGSVSAPHAKRTAAVWSGASQGLCFSEKPSVEKVKSALPMPMRSTWPLANIFSLSISKSMNFSDELPALTTRTLRMAVDIR